MIALLHFSIYCSLIITESKISFPPSPAPRIGCIGALVQAKALVDSLLFSFIGRATADFVVKKSDGSTPFLDQNTGNVSDQMTLKIVLDGYSSPISAGNFASNVVKGIYNGQVISADRTALAAGAGLEPDRTIPLEILPAGDFEPLYRTPIDVQSGERPVLPLSIQGAVSMAKSQASDYAAAGDEFFVYKFNRAEAGLAGMSFDEGNFGVFGYVVSGLDELEKLTNGDVIVSAKLTSGADRLQQSEELTEQ